MTEEATKTIPGSVAFTAVRDLIGSGLYQGDDALKVVKARMFIDQIIQAEKNAEDAQRSNLAPLVAVPDQPEAVDAKVEA